jgi:hypothetical protein
MSRFIVALANVDRPPDTSTFKLLGDAQTASAVEVVRRRLLRRRARIGGGTSSAGELDAIVAALRRLQGPHLAAYRRNRSVLLSEPFGAVPSSVARAPRAAAFAAVRQMFGHLPPARLVNALAKFGDRALQAAVRGGVRLALVPEGRRFSEYSLAVASLVPGLDEWSSPPSGLFVVEERRVLLRSKALSMTAAHEFAHALDAVIATRPRSYFSYENEEVRHLYSSATGFVNEYAASGLDEYFAESIRAYLEINDSRCAWLPLTRYDLRARDPRMFDLIDSLFRSAF